MPRKSTYRLILIPITLIVLIAVIWLASRKIPATTVTTSTSLTTTNHPGTEQAPLETISFNAHIRPILSDKCFSCHGFDSTTREENLRLDTQEGAFAALDSNPEVFAIIPGNPQKSAVWQRIHSTDRSEIMPPPNHHKPLSEHEKILMTRWIEQGAAYQEHWAFAPIEKPAPPTNHHDELAANPIDHFIFSKLSSANREPSPLADKTTLLRRLSLDLIGLPPSPQELTAFLKDDSTDAYEKQVKRLLDSPHYGERMAVPWLDAVRFADTVGYHGDQNIRIHPYRDYVIESINANKPFDQFTREQLAGDLIENPTDEQLIATGFLRLNLMTREGGAQHAEYLAKSTGDRVRSIGAAWLGLTTGCAECHDHKFDPFTARDFYTLGAFFGDVRQWGVYSHYNSSPNPDLPGSNNDWPFPPEIQTLNRATQERLAIHQGKATEALAKIIDTENHPDFPAWQQKTQAFLAANPTGWFTLVPSEVSTEKNTPHRINPDHSALFTGPPVADETITITYPLPADISFRTIRLEALPDPENHDKIGRQKNGKFAFTPTLEINGKALEKAYQQADRRTPHRYRNGNHAPLLEDEWRSAPAVWEEPSHAATLTHHAHYHLNQTHLAADGETLTLTIKTADLGKIRLSITPFADPIPGQPNAHQSNLAAAFAHAITPEAKLPAEYKTLRQAIIDSRAGFAHSLVAQTLPDDKIIPTHILPRGDWMNPAEKVEPAFPEFLAKHLPPSETRLTRLDLADWLTAPETPLTARHYVNRLWKQLFGKGLSNILDDLGNQSEWPSHPELLDWLAAEFRDSAWDMKHMVHLIVTSHTYRQAAISDPTLAETDPENRLLSGQSPRRLDAEFIRDNALAIAGLIRTDIIGGPSVFPYQPDGYYANLNFPERGYPTSGEFDQHRRGLYTHWQRTFVHPFMAGFDAPSREECAADRFLSNSPQQALTLLNDPSMVEAAKSFAKRIHHEKPDASPTEKITHAYHLALSRPPTETETAQLLAFLTEQQKLHPEPIAWEQLARVILNLHETITRF